jgi:phosphoglycolate phosphatase
MEDPMPRLALFDCDGTLTEGQYRIIAIMTAAFEAEGLTPPSPESVRKIIGLSLEDGIPRVAPGLSADVYARLVAGYKAFFHEKQAGRQGVDEPLFPGIRDALQALHRDGWILGVATGKGQRGLGSVLDQHDLRPFFTTLRTADIDPGKPHPGMVLNALAHTGVVADRAVMIGDTSFDMQMGKSAGVKTIGVTWGYHAPDDLVAAGANRIVESAFALPDVLNDLIGKSA